MELIDKLNWIIDHGINPRRSEIHEFINWSPITHDDFDRYWEFHRYETVYYSEFADWILEEIWNGDLNKIYDDHHFVNDLNYIENLVNKMYEDGQKGYWGFKYDW